MRGKSSMCSFKGGEWQGQSRDKEPVFERLEEEKDLDRWSGWKAEVRDGGEK